MGVTDAFESIFFKEKRVGKDRLFQLEIDRSTPSIGIVDRSIKLDATNKEQKEKKKSLEEETVERKAVFIAGQNWRPRGPSAISARTTQPSEP
jgi:hypothetical protein